MRGIALSIALLLSLTLFAVMSLGIEKLAAAGRLGPRVCFT